jgi:hypothetical protein
MMICVTVASFLTMKMMPIRVIGDANTLLDGGPSTQLTQTSAPPPLEESPTSSTASTDAGGTETEDFNLGCVALSGCTLQGHQR